MSALQGSEIREANLAPVLPSRLPGDAQVW